MTGTTGTTMSTTGVASSSTNNSASSASASTSATTSKGGKKGKKKPTAKPSSPTSPSGPSNSTSSGSSAAATASATSVDQDLHDFDWMDQLECPPLVPDNWEEAIPPASGPPPPSDHTLLGTLSMTLSSLRLQLTAYQLYTWVIATHSNDVVLVKKTYLLGLTVWIAPHYQSLAVKLLGQLQVTALQLARLQHGAMGTSPATAWAAQTALWQLDPSLSMTIPMDEKKRATLLRLAESLAAKCLTMTSQDHVLETEHFMLYMKTLDGQAKWEGKLEVLQQRLDQQESVPHPRPTVLRELKVSCLAALGRYEEAQEELAQLLHSQPDHWEYWKLYLHNRNRSWNSDKDNDNALESLVEQVTQPPPMPNEETAEGEIAETSSSSYPLRGPHLAKIEWERMQWLNHSENPSSGSSSTSAIVDEIIQYGTLFAQRTLCTFTDISTYLDSVFEKRDNEEADSRMRDDAIRILTWIRSSFRPVPDSSDPSERRKQLRGYTFGVQVSYKVLHQFPDLEEEWLPHWHEIVTVWKDFQAFEDIQQAQKENRAADDLILLAVQQIARSSKDDSTIAQVPRDRLFLAAAILEVAIAYSPHNAYLKIAGIDIYRSLHSVRRAFDLFRQIYVKHIQHESCAYIILPVLREGGFYQETISVCQEILRLQTSSIRDTAEFTGRAMDSGTLEKASEFIMFQRERMNKSLTTLEAKGLILDCAPMFQFEEDQGLGAVHGIVGGPEDHGRVCKMIAEAHNPHAAFSLLRLRGSAEDNIELFTENRDFDILSFNILSLPKLPSRQEILGEAIRRRHHHSMLIRASLCLEATKGPKKGKVTKPSDIMSKRCSSLLACVQDSQEYISSGCLQSELAQTSMSTMVWLCRTILAVSAGVGDDEKKSGTPDSLESREAAATRFLEKAVEATKQSQSVFLATFTENPVPVVSRYVADCLVSIFALFQMCATVFELYGWGKRKRSTRQSAAALATLALALKDMIEQMRSSMDVLPTELDPGVHQGKIDHVLDQAELETLVARITTDQMESKGRIVSILSSMMVKFYSFDVAV